jgi:hypothetical protein
MRKPSKTIRIDSQSHMEMMRLAHRLKVQSGRHYSLADVVRAGMTALAIQQDRKERRDGVPTDRQEDR